MTYRFFINVDGKDVEIKSLPEETQQQIKQDLSKRLKQAIERELAAS